jgi:hypothetical protein
MPEMTKEEADALDELWAETTPKVNPVKSGVFARNGFAMVSLDALSAAYIRSRSDATHKTPEEIIGELVRKEIAANVPA